MNYGKISNVLIFGGSSTCLYAAKLLREKGCPVAVFTGERLLEESIGSKTLREGLDREGIQWFSVEDIHQCPELDRFISSETFAFSIGSPWIFKEPLLGKLEPRFVNIHPVSIPKMDGGAHFTWQILMNSRVGATTIQLVRSGLNRGELLVVDEYSFSSKARIPQDYFSESLKNIHRATELFIDRLLAGETWSPKPVDMRFRTFFPRLYTKLHGFIDWNMNVHEIERFICAFDSPYPGASTYLDGEKYFLKGVWSDTSEGSFHPFMRGIIYKKRSGCLQVACRGGALLIHQVFDASGKECLETLGIGKRFYTPLEKLQDALKYEALFDAKGVANASEEERP